MIEDQERHPQTPGTPKTPGTPQTPETPKSPQAPELPETPLSPETPGLVARDWSGSSEMEDLEDATGVEQIHTMSTPVDEKTISDGLLSKVASCIEQLRATSTSAEEKEIVSRILFELADTQEDARAAVGSHTQAVPSLVALLRSGSLPSKVNVATILGVLCKEEDLRVKVLLGGCIPPLLALLKSTSSEAQTVAADALNAVSQGGAKDHVGSKIFSTEGVVLSLWEQLQTRQNLDPSLPGLLTGALRNLQFLSNVPYQMGLL